MAALADMEVSDAELAELVGVSARHIRRLGLPKIGRNAYRLGDAIPALLEGLSGGDAGAELTRERVRLVKAQANTAEMNFLLAKKEIAPVAQMAKAVELRNAMIRARMMQVPQRAIVQIVAERDESRIKSVLRAEIVQALTSAAEDELTAEIPDEEPGSHADSEETLTDGD